MHLLSKSIIMRNGNNENHQEFSATESRNRPLGGYLLEAGLISPAQLEVALNDQKMMSGMRVGEILVARGWIKEQTVEYLMRKVIMPERQQADRHQKAVKQGQVKRTAVPIPQSTQTQPPDAVAEFATPRKPAHEPKLAWGELPVYRPMPTATDDDDVHWAD